MEFQPSGRTTSITQGGLISQAAAQAGERLPSECGGRGRCGRCLVQPTGQVSPMDQYEKRVLAQVKAQPGMRLACRSQAITDQTVSVPQDGEDRWQVMDHLGDMQQTRPAVARLPLAAPPPDMNDQRADLSRVADALPPLTHGQIYHAGPAALARLSTLARQCDWRFDAFVRNGEIIGAAAPGGEMLGLAVDLGTTKLAAYLLDLQSGEVLGSQGLLNPQASYGADVISRLNGAMKSPDNAQRLADSVRRAINQLAAGLVSQAGADPQQLADICLVGNTAMIQLLLALPAQQLAVSPFVCSADTPLDMAARDLDLDAAPGANVHIPPGVGGFVGADHVAMILGAGLEQSSGIHLGLDIGTNTEIVLCLPGSETPLLVASAPSGPAFEGAHLSCGMRLASGAVCKVWLDGASVAYSTLDGMAPAGLCGSGIIDLVAALRKAEIIDERGHLDLQCRGVRDGVGGPEFVLAKAGQTATDRDLAISQEDIVQVQLAKAAIMAGVEVLFDQAGVQKDGLDQVVLAGSFGSHFNVENAMSIGMLPRLEAARFHQVGNAAGLGAQMILTNLAQRARAARIPQKTRYLELTMKPEFRKLMTHSLTFSPV